MDPKVAFPGMAETNPGIQVKASRDALFTTNDFSRMVEKLLTDEIAAEKLKNTPLWAFLTNSYKLTFFEKFDGDRLENLFEASVCAYIRSIPKSSYTPENHQLIQQARLLFLANTKRAIGTDEKRMNERIALLSQIKHQISEFSENRAGGSPGLLKRGLGKIFGR